MFTTTPDHVDENGKTRRRGTEGDTYDRACTEGRSVSPTSDRFGRSSRCGISRRIGRWRSVYQPAILEPASLFKTKCSQAQITKYDSPIKAQSTIHVPQFQRMIPLPKTRSGIQRLPVDCRRVPRVIHPLARAIQHYLECPAFRC